MKINVYESPVALGAAAAAMVVERLNAAIAQRGRARLLVSTGASQFDTFKGLAAVKDQVDWSKVDMYHLDEYIGLPEDHPATFRTYLKARTLAYLPFGGVHFVNPEGDINQVLADLEKDIRSAPIDLGLIGVGENAHIAFNDPPADFDTRAAFAVVTLDEACRKQQMGEGWFPTLEDVPKQAISMTPYQIMQCKAIISCVPYPVKANAVKAMLEAPATTNMIPATLLREHADMTLMLDKDSAAKADPKYLKA